MYITNRPEIAQIAESAGVDRIFVDLEYIGKALRFAVLGVSWETRMLWETVLRPEETTIHG